MSPRLKLGSVDEVKRSDVKLVLLSKLSVVPAIHVVPGGLASEVRVSVEESTGDPVMEATDSVLAIRESTPASVWLRSIALMG